MQTIDEAAKEFSSYEPVQIGFKAGIAFAQRWISVEEELPEEEMKSSLSINVLVKSPNAISPIVAFYNFGSKKWVFYGHNEHLIVTHWRPINLK